MRRHWIFLKLLFFLLVLVSQTWAEAPSDISSLADTVLKMSRPVYFTRAKEKEHLWIERKREAKQTLSGEEARDFYQTLLQERDGERPKEGEAATIRRVRRGAGRWSDMIPASKKNDCFILIVFPSNVSWSQLLFWMI